MGFGAAWVCSETFVMAEDPKASAVGEKCHRQAAGARAWASESGYHMGFQSTGTMIMH